jgi:hypothetical protein
MALLVGLALAIGILIMALAFGWNPWGIVGPGVQAPGPNGGQGNGNPGPGTVTYRGSDSTGDLPLISMRDFTGGDAPITTSGTFTLSETMPMHPPATFADGTETTLIYGDMLANEYVDVGFSTLDGSEGLGLNVYSGDWRAVYQGQGCSWVVDVAPTSVSGHISCTDIPAYNDADGSTGSIDIELDFSADSAEAASSLSPG